MKESDYHDRNWAAKLQGKPQISVQLPTVVLVVPRAFICPFVLSFQGFGEQGEKSLLDYEDNWWYTRRENSGKKSLLTSTTIKE